MNTINYVPQVYSWTDLERKKLLNLLKKEKVTNDDSESDSKIDWENIANSFHGERTAIQCYSEYYNYLDPTINKSSWSSDEDLKLLNLVNLHQKYDWTLIAEELATNRTAWQCLQRYQQTLNHDMIKSKWTLEEDAQLKELASRLIDDENNTDWVAVASYFPGRSSYQCNLKFRRSIVCQDNATEGRWTLQDEKRLFHAAVVYDAPLLAAIKRPQQDIFDMKVSLGLIPSTSSSRSSSDNLVPTVPLLSSSSSSSSAQSSSSSLFTLSKPKKIDMEGFSWKLVADMVPGKDENKCREKWTNSLDPTIIEGDMTEDEDKLLLALVGRFGPGAWASLAQYFPGRTDRRLFLRWKRISGKLRIFDDSLCLLLVLLSINHCYNSVYVSIYIYFYICMHIRIDKRTVEEHTVRALKKRKATNPQVMR